MDPRFHIRHAIHQEAFQADNSFHQQRKSHKLNNFKTCITWKKSQVTLLREYSRMVKKSPFLPMSLHASVVSKTFFFFFFQNEDCGDYFPNIYCTLTSLFIPIAEDLSCRILDPLVGTKNEALGSGASNGRFVCADS